jgi:hypothetical protein
MKNHIQVSNTKKPLVFYLNLAKVFFFIQSLSLSVSVSVSLCFTALSCFVVAIMSYVLLVCRESRERKMGNREFVESLGFSFLVHAMTNVYDAFLRS